jgi:hypothetical protein
VGGGFQSLREAWDGVHSEAGAAEEGREMVRDGSSNPEVAVAPRAQDPDRRMSLVRLYSLWDIPSLSVSRSRSVCLGDA